MKLWRRRIGGAVVAGVVAGQSSGFTSETALARQVEVVVNRDIDYGPAPTDRRADAARRLDLYRPGGTRRNAVAFIAIHGGGFTRGDKADENVADLCRALALRGIVCASINYRLAGSLASASGGESARAVVDSAVSDARRALEWMRVHANALGTRADLIAVGGASAGGTIALRLGYESRDSAASDRPLRVRAVFSWSGTLDGLESLIQPHGPPLLIVHGAADSVVPVHAAYSLAEHAARAGVPYELLVCRGLGHTVPLDRRPSGRQIHDRLAAFLQAPPASGPHGVGARFDAPVPSSTEHVKSCPK